MGRVKKQKEHTSHNRFRNSVVPAILAAGSISIIVAIFGFIKFDIRYGVGVSAILFSAFAASAFILFLMPKSNSARLTKFIKSYIIGSIVGYIGITTATAMQLPLYITTAVFIFITIALMVATRSEHAPGVAIAFAFILYHIDIYGILVVALGVVILLVVRVVLEKAIFVLEEDITYIERKL